MDTYFLVNFAIIKERERMNAPIQIPDITSSILNHRERPNPKPTATVHIGHIMFRLYTKKLVRMMFADMHFSFNNPFMNIRKFRGNRLFGFLEILIDSFTESINGKKRTMDFDRR